jgi:sugar phosphate isomerase/epimerase
VIQLAFSTISCPDYTIGEVAKAAEEYGYDGVELYALEGSKLTPAILARRRSEFRRELGAIPVACINSFVSLSTTDDDQRSLNEAEVMSTVESAVELGSPLVKAFGGEIDRGDPERTFDDVAASIRRIVTRAAGLGVTLVVETHDGFCLGADLRELLVRVDSPGFQALWDIHHTYRMGETVAETDRLIGDRVRHVHVKDAVRDGDGWDYTALGNGEIPVRELIGVLRARDFSGFVSLDWEKMWHPEIAGAEVVLPQYREKLQEYLSK